MADHAVLPASGAGRWMVCTPSARLEEKVTDEGSEYAREGTLAHAVAELIFKHPKRRWTAESEAILKKKYPEDYALFFCAEMLRHAEDFVNYVYERVPLNGKYYLFVEHRLDTSNFIPEGFGTMDAGLIYLEYDLVTRLYRWVLETFDLKYGKGVAVSAIDNKQQKIYALGMINEFGMIFNIEHVRMHIYQPRIANNSDWEIPVSHLMIWAEGELAPAARLAFAGEGEFVPGEHCNFCKIKAQCRALAEYNLELARHEFMKPALLNPDELIEIYEMRDHFESWLKAVGEYVLKTALNGTVYPGYKIVRAGTKRRYSNENAVVESLKLILPPNKINTIFKPQALLGFGELEGLLGTEIWMEYVVPLLEKPEGGPTLALSSDERPEYQSASEFGVYVDDEDNDLL